MLVLCLQSSEKQLPDDSSVFRKYPISPIDLAQLGRQVVQICKTPHPIAKLLNQCVCLVLASIRKAICLMIRVCFGNSQISPIDVAQLGRQVVQISKTVYAIAKLNQCVYLLAIIRKAIA